LSPTLRLTKIGYYDTASEDLVLAAPIGAIGAKLFWKPSCFSMPFSQTTFLALSADILAGGPRGVWI